MRLLNLLTVVATATAIALAEAEANGVNIKNNKCKYADYKELAVSKAAFLYYKLVPKKKSDFDDRKLSFPNVVPEFNPVSTISAKYGSTKVTYGNVITTSQTVMQPELNFTNEPKYDPYKTKYTVFLTDPDVPSPDAAAGGQFLHWSFYDAQPDCVANQVRKDNPMYQAPSPPSPARHRYTFLVYRQPKDYTPEPIVARSPFKVNDYVRRNKLEGPIAGNLFQQGALDAGA